MKLLKLVKLSSQLFCVSTLALGFNFANVQNNKTNVTTENQNETIYTESKQGISVTSDSSKFTIKLKSNPTTGYSWFLREYDKQLIQPLDHQFIAPENKKLMGAPGYETWTFKVNQEAFKVPHQTIIRFVYARPWEIQDETQIIFKVTSK